MTPTTHLKHAHFQFNSFQAPNAGPVLAALESPVCVCPFPTNDHRIDDLHRTNHVIVLYFPHNNKTASMVIKLHPDIFINT